MYEPLFFCAHNQGRRSRTRCRRRFRGRRSRTRCTAEDSEAIEPGGGASQKIPRPSKQDEVRCSAEVGKCAACAPHPVSPAQLSTERHPIPLLRHSHSEKRTPHPASPARQVCEAPLSSAPCLIQIVNEERHVLRGEGWRIRRKSVRRSVSRRNRTSRSGWYAASAAFPSERQQAESCKPERVVCRKHSISLVLLCGGMPPAPAPITFAPTITTPIRPALSRRIICFYVPI